MADDTGAALATRSVEEIDRRLQQLRADQAATTDPQVAGALERQLLQLEADRRLAAVIAAAQRRREAAERAAAAHADFERLQTDLPPAVHEAAAALDQWVADGAHLAAVYRAAVERLQVVHDLLEPAEVGREFDLLRCRERLALEQHLAARLTAARVLALDVPRGASTCEALAVLRVEQLFRTARGRLPAGAPDRGAGAEGYDPTT